MTKRKVVYKRKTRETGINISLDLDGEGKSDCKTGIDFLDHMLTLFAKHSLFNLKVKAKGDLKVDIHHTNEDVGIALGEALSRALKDKRGICRFGWAYVPMEEALSRVVLDISGRPVLSLSLLDGTKVSASDLPSAQKAGYTFKDAEHFLVSFTRHGGITLHIGINKDRDLHHLLEAIFKALGLALRQAVKLDKDIKGIPSTKGRL